MFHISVIQILRFTPGIVLNAKLSTKNLDISIPFQISKGTSMLKGHIFNRGSQLVVNWLGLGTWHREDVFIYPFLKLRTADKIIAKKSKQTDSG